MMSWEGLVKALEWFIYILTWLFCLCASFAIVFIGPPSMGWRPIPPTVQWAFVGIVMLYLAYDVRKKWRTSMKGESSGEEGSADEQ